MLGRNTDMQRAVYPGSFDPITYGHMDIIDRAAEVFDEVIVLIMYNDEKTGTFTVEERLDMVQNVIKKYDNVTVMAGDGLTVDMARKLGANILIRGIRAVTDYEYEMQLATANMVLAEDVHTVFLVAKPEYSFLSSSTAKSIAKCKGDISSFVPDYVREKMEEKYGYHYE